MHILIAEDYPDLQKILTLYLQKEGYQVSREAEILKKAGVSKSGP